MRAWLARIELNHEASVAMNKLNLSYLVKKINRVLAMSAQIANNELNVN